MGTPFAETLVSDLINTAKTTQLSPIKVWMSNDYYQFSRILANRPVDNRRVGQLVQAIQQGKNQLHRYPILVNRQLEIVDGQHRHAAAEIAQVWLYYIVDEEMTIDDAVDGISRTKDWTMRDYLHHFVAKGFIDYIQLNEFYKSYESWMPFSFATNLCSTNSYQRPLFKGGHFKADRVAFGHKVAQYALDFREYIDFFNTGAFLNTLSNLTANKNYDHRQMMNKMKYRSSEFVRQATVESYLDLFSRIYNYRQAPSTHVFFIDQYRRQKLG